MLDNVLYALTHVFDLKIILFMILGVVVGIVVGGMPGLSVTIAVALILPFTFGMDPALSILMLLAVYCSGIYGGSIGAILLNTPGTAASAATAADGFALTQKGKTGQALGMSLYASVIAGLLSGVVLLFVAPQIAKFALGFGPPEYFTLALFGLTIIAAVSGKSLAKGLVMACLGILISTVGIDPINGNTRLTFDTMFLMAGISLIPALLGLFAISEILKQSQIGINKLSVNGDVDDNGFGWRNVIPFRKTILKSSLIGVIIGAIPGTGGSISSFLAVNEARRVSKDPDSYGKGNLDGVAASEAGNNGTTGATLIPMMTLGIPGDVVTAVLLGALLIQGLQPGPQLFQNHGGLVYTIMIGFILVNIILFIVAKLAIKQFAKVSRVPASILFPIVLVCCLVGSFAYDNSMRSVWFALFFGIVGYILPKYGYSVVPMLIGIILGPLAETSLRRSLVLSNESLLIFFQRPISLFFIILIVLSLVLPLIKKFRESKEKPDDSISLPK
ncbi:tripartite tricarboxylate transporter permease [Alkalihalobacillus sp. MEB130]|uniref:tripartite tricarboxylate transporter permease n=1 Tax=Alkalihalobacillus sp. MEB130 TaxID=2976704 RepID=UPI0028DE42C1|nr:tripartite tricarboxylate transporter permease [Alkalihalobacillus sp. MEB130]MDT8861330.1 tripartite tricarboxylate transporter permease [Alkalihalobacillus sp. MEB130]